MTARVFAYICRCCGLVVAELRLAGRCPICLIYGCPAVLVETGDPADVIAALAQGYVDAHPPLAPAPEPVPYAVD